jgi:hypothetical protein
MIGKLSDFACLKYSLDIGRESDGAPPEVVLKGGVLLGAILLFGFLAIRIVYLSHYL